jgi:threonine/homoserine/homoserine lactone efflux protein
MLPDITHLLFFMFATLLLNLTPGSDVLFIGSQSLISRRHGILALLGTSTGIAIWIGLTVIGLAQVLHRSIWLFNMIKFIGAAYLLFLAWQAFFSNKTDGLLSIRSHAKQDSRHSYYKGVLTNVLNPKVGLFFLTFLPQFINTSRGLVWLQLLSLGICFIISCTLVNLMYVFIFTYMKDRMFENLGFRKILDKITGVIFCALALKIITAKPS